MVAEVKLIAEEEGVIDIAELPKFSVPEDPVNVLVKVIE